jgi:DNA-binding beta-propeller fold protein YncE
MSVAANGALTPIAGSSVQSGASPSQALISPDKKLLFGADFLAPAASPPQGSLRSFVIGANQLLTNAPGMPMDLPLASNGMPDTSGALGLATHPSRKILYVGFPQRNQVGVYNYDATTGALSFVVATPVTGAAPCWTRTNSSGTRLYVVTSANNSVSVLDATNPLAPAEIQNFNLKDPGPLYQNAAGTMVPTSQAFQEELSPDGRFLYVVSQRTTTDPTVTEGNVLHALTIGPDGKLSEPLADIKLPVPTEARPQGLVVF